MKKLDDTAVASRPVRSSPDRVVRVRALVPVSRKPRKLFGPVKHRSKISNLTITEHSRPQSLRSFWPAAGIESSGSNHFEITKEITVFCPSGLTQPSSMAHARNGCSQSSRFLPQARRIVGSGDENDYSAYS